MTVRQICQVLNSRASTDGDGVRIRRTLGQHLHDLDPFLMLDEIRSADSADYIGGFPPHPHRGIETLTYMLAGGFVHEDSLDHRAELADGGAQWMSAGRGVIHSELPLIHDGLLHGFQLWINLPAARKMQTPSYQQADRDALPTATLADGSQLRAIAGRWTVAGQALASPLANLSANARVLDITLPADGSLTIELPAADTALAYVFDGAMTGHATTGENITINTQQMARYGTGDTLVLHAGPTGARLLLLTGSPLGEPIAQYGPFVMNTEEQIRQAIDDYRQGRFV